MSLCTYCQQKAGKRTCPALRRAEDGLICPTCCGRHRGIDINCPISCKYFKAHENYQRARLSEEFHALWIAKTEPLYGKERLLDFIAFLEMLVYQFYREKSLGTDADVAEAFEFLQRRLGPITIIEATGTTLGNHLWNALQGYFKKESLSPEDAQEGLAKSLEILKAYTDPIQPRKYLHGLLGHVERYFKLPPELKESQLGAPQLIATPQIVTPES